MSANHREGQVYLSVANPNNERNGSSQTKYAWFFKHRWLWTTLILLVVASASFAGGYAVGRLTNCVAPDSKSAACNCVSSSSKVPQDYNKTVSQAVQKSITASDITWRLKNYTANNHLSGSAETKLLFWNIALEWHGAGLSASAKDYWSTLLQYPIADKPNTVEVVLGDRVTKSAKTNSRNFNAYSNVGSFAGKLLYVNYGTAKDFETLKRSLKGCPSGEFVAIAKYGNRRSIVEQAEKWCATSTAGRTQSSSPIRAVLLYGDPADFAPNASQVYPNGAYLRGSDVIVGSIGRSNGDPLTPGLPSVPGMVREDEESVRSTWLYVQPVSYDDAAMLMSELGGEAIDSWRGGLPIAYRTGGPGYSGAQADSVVRVTVNSDKTLNRRDLRNIIGKIKGAAEADRYVIVGAHYDSWSNGAVDPSGATALLTQLGLALQNQTKAGWRPRRTIILAHWDGGIYNRIGSQEFLEQFGPEIKQRTVAYINLDSVVNGLYTFDAQGHPLLSQVMYDATKQFDFPGESKSVYDIWRARLQWPVPGSNTPPVEPAGADSDSWSFLSQFGIPYFYPRFAAANRRAPAARHTEIDTFDTVNKFIDPDLRFHELLGRIVADTVLRLSDSAVLPYTFAPFAVSLQSRFNELVKADLARLNVSSSILFSMDYTINSFVDDARNYDAGLKLNSSMDDVSLRELNDRLMLIPQLFVSQYNIEYRKTPNLLYSDEDYGSVAYFPGLRRAINDLSAKDDANANARGLRMLEKELSALDLAIYQATNFLNGYTLS